MRKPYPKSDPLYGRYGLGVFVQDLGPTCGTVLNHNGSPPGGYAALMYSTPDGRVMLHHRPGLFHWKGTGWNAF
ncbi:hypothetical protein ACIBKY_32655 [Nonomuraea sp. NPDC050394]|uniref:hypothetical protein n=1 Tax=Nonomuraea sp. NPDC050394 TaxID=3364363 RepID=UPI003796BE3A